MADLTYTQLTKAIAEFAETVIRSSGAIHARAQKLEDDAQDTSRIAEQIGAMRVDKATIAETRELAKIMSGLSEQALTYANSGDTTARTAKAAGDQANASHGDFYEAAARSVIGPEVYDIDRTWFRQE
ncbi:hypothetical protein ACL07V_37445 [Streptomyces sp. MB22_4]|uniref:hypothetical protein n=1 Tax=Streptomyces sp. MB22_4 TaxID=3383120 RepID=UPI0039A24DCF